MRKQYMYKKELVTEILIQVLEALKIIERRFNNINSPDAFLVSEEGLDMLDSICMQLIAIGESIKNIDKITNRKLLINYPEIDWKGIKGVRDIISHHYFDIDAEQIFNVCNNNIEPLTKTLMIILEDLKK